MHFCPAITHLLEVHKRVDGRGALCKAGVGVDDIQRVRGIHLVDPALHGLLVAHVKLGDGDGCASGLHLSLCLLEHGLIDVRESDVLRSAPSVLEGQSSADSRCASCKPFGSRAESQVW